MLGINEGLQSLTLINHMIYQTLIDMVITQVVGLVSGMKAFKSNLLLGCWLSIFFGVITKYLCSLVFINIKVIIFHHLLGFT